jgi:hypothetical protein
MPWKATFGIIGRGKWQDGYTLDWTGTSGSLGCPVTLMR